MTTNQINYWSLQERRRSALVTEAETERHNRAVEEVSRGELEEKSRSNLEQERIRWGELAETTRHNSQVESESHRHNVAQERYNAQSLGETVRHNTMTERQAANELAEHSRHNLADEQIRTSQVTETNRHNVATEDETRRHNIVNEVEDAALGAWQRGETTRHNLATENIERLKAMQKHTYTTNNTYNINVPEINSTGQTSGNTGRYQAPKETKTTSDQFTGGKVGAKGSNPTGHRGGPGEGTPQSVSKPGLGLDVKKLGPTNVQSWMK